MLVMHVSAHVLECITSDFINGLHCDVRGELCARIIMDSNSFCMVGKQQNMRPVTDGVCEGRWHRECLGLEIQVLWDVAPCQ